ncbi:MAG: HIT domain-containing protein [Candidatus Pacebacteria bacterium]|nr:HIT domain-containing protein [Candidatus Paceibacterota bacterium]
MSNLPTPPKESIYYEDHKLYVCLAVEPKTKGHSIVVWKEEKDDLKRLNIDDYEYLMDAVKITRESLRKFYGVEKVYLMYIDEAKHIHWHLIPRYKEMGFEVLNKGVEIQTEFKDSKELENLFKRFHNKVRLNK